MKDEPDSRNQQDASFTGSQNIDDYVKGVMTSVRGCQKLSTELQGWHHYRDYVGVQRVMEQVNSRIITLISKVFSHQDIKLGLSKHKLLDQFDMVREGNDALLERINSDIDEASGLRKNTDTELLEPTIRKVQGPSVGGAEGRNVVLMTSRHVQKPQLYFPQKVNNSRKEPFIPIIKEKPNNIKPLSILICIDGAGDEYYSHPYEYELQHWTPPPSQLEPATPIPPQPIQDTPICMVDTEEELKNMVEDLKACKEFAADVEHHSFRSYLGLACLMQISTRENDYIVDTLALRGKMTILNEVFTDPKITKVMHGTDYDVLWLQRDCGVYIVNLFDTHQAAVVLEYPHRSLAALLHRFCQIQADKVYQRADWRIRPLPEDFIFYARQDSHYLLYIYDLMRNELIERGNQLNNLISAVYSRSTELCMKRYEKPKIGPDSHLELYRRSRKTFNSRQQHALRALYIWRDKIAREQDESAEYVLPKHMLLQIAEVLPKEMQGILACCNPIPPLVKTELLTLHTIIRESREQPLREIQEVPLGGEHSADGTNSSEDVNANLICIHDLSQCDENPSDLSTLLDPRETLLGDLFKQHRVNVSPNKSSVMFGSSKIQHRSRIHLEITEEFMSPYSRYKTYLDMKPLLEENKKDKSEKVDRLDRVREHFMSLTNNTVSEPGDENSIAADEGSQEDSRVNKGEPLPPFPKNDDRTPSSSTRDSEYPRKVFRPPADMPVSRYSTPPPVAPRPPPVTAREPSDFARPISPAAKSPPVATQNQNKDVARIDRIRDHFFSMLGSSMNATKKANPVSSSVMGNSNNTTNTASPSVSSSRNTFSMLGSSTSTMNKASSSVLSSRNSIMWGSGNEPDQPPQPSKSKKSLSKMQRKVHLDEINNFLQKQRLAEKLGNKDVSPRISTQKPSFPTSPSKRSAPVDFDFPSDETKSEVRNSLSFEEELQKYKEIQMRKNQAVNKPMVLADEIVPKWKTKGTKRNKGEGHEGAKKKRKSEEGVVGIKTDEKEEGELTSSGSDEGNEAEKDNGNGQPSQVVSFDYASVDYTMFQKPVQRQGKKKQIEDNFRKKGQQHYGQKGKTSMKTFSWGGARGGGNRGSGNRGRGSRRGHR